jgi:hypothetical protein
MAVPVIITNVSAEGTLNTQVRRQVATLLRGMAGRTVQIRVGLHKSPRSVPQNKRYWSMLQAGADSLGYDTTEELHEACAWHLLREPDDQRVGVTPRRQRTPRLNSQEFGDYTDKVQRLLLEYGADLSAWGEREIGVTDGY